MLSVKFCDNFWGLQMTFYDFLGRLLNFGSNFSIFVGYGPIKDVTEKTVEEFV